MKQIWIHDIDYPKIRELIFDSNGNYINDDISVDTSNVYFIIKFIRDEDYNSFLSLITELGITPN